MTPEQITAAAVVAVIVAVLCWQIRRALRSDDYRTRNDRRQAAWIAVCEGRPEPGAPGTDDELLNACNQLCPDLARKEDR